MPFSLKKEYVEFAKSTFEKKNKNSVMKRTVENNSDVLSAITSPLLTYEMVKPCPLCAPVSSFIKREN